MATVSVAQLLKVDEKEFDASIQEMSLKGLLDTISVLQKEMGREQENFNSLSSELGSLKKNSGQYKSVAKDMAKSQTKLTLLMNRSMKCFAQQGNRQAKTGVARKNSLKEAQKPDAHSKNRYSADLETRPTKRAEPISIQTTPATQDTGDSSKDATVVSSYSFSDALSKFGGKTSQNGGTAVTNQKSTVTVSKPTSVSQKSAVTSDPKKRLSGNFTVTTNSVTVKDNNPSAKSVVSSRSSVESQAKFSPRSSSSQQQSLGPLASQNKSYLSKSTDSILAKPKSDTNMAKPDAGFSSNKPSNKLVLTADKQMMDLDSFTDRKNMLAELKLGKKDLKPTQTKVQVDNGDENTNGNENGADIKPVKKDSGQQRSNLLGDIRGGKKPSELKDKNSSGNKTKENGALHVKFADESVQSNGTEVSNKGDEVTTIAESNKDNTQVGDKSGVENIPKTEAKLLATSNEVTIAQAGVYEGDEEESGSTSSEVSEGDSNYVTEFQFPGISQAPQETTQKSTDGTKQKTAPPVPVTGLQKVLDSGSHSNQASTSKGQGQKVEEDGEELVKQTRVNFSDWDPGKLLEELYRVTLQPDNIEDISHQFIGMEGLMEKLPMNKKKATLLKTWKRRFFKAKDGWLYYYETGNRDKPSDSLQLMGGRVEELGQRVLGVDDGRGKYLMVRVPTDNEYGQWKVALESQTADNVKATYVRPSPSSPPNNKKKVIVIDIGSSGIRAGVLTEKPTLPQIFFPSVVAIHKQTGEIIVGAEALRPTVRKLSTIHYPIRPTNKVDKFNIDIQIMTAIFKKVFTELKVRVTDYLVMLSTPQNLGDNLKGSLMKILMDECHVRGVCMVHQCLLALYSYNAMSGIIVDIGERLEILPIYDGLLIEGGMSRQAYGGEKVLDSLHISLLENRYRFNSPVEKLLVRYLMEKGCYVAEDYKASRAGCDTDPDKHKVTVNLQDFFIPDGGHRSVTLDYGFFKSPEGFFNTEMWEMDYKNLQKQIFAAIQQCPMDSRKQMYRSVYLSGGVTMVPGFADRLQAELKKLAPPAALVEVHASPQRYHAAYIGACSVAGMDVFEMSCVLTDEWKKQGVKACKKWGM